MELLLNLKKKKNDLKEKRDKLLQIRLTSMK